MGSATSHVDIAATPDAVWAVLRDVCLLPKLSPGTVSVRAPGPLHSVGQRFDQTVELAGRSFTSTWEVLEIDPGRRLVIEGSVLPGTRYRMTESIEPLEAGDEPRTRVRLTMEYRLPFGPLGRLAERLGAERRAVAEARQVLDGVRALAEDGDAATSGTSRA